MLAKVFTEALPGWCAETDFLLPSDLTFFAVRLYMRLHAALRRRGFPVASGTLRGGVAQLVRAAES